MDLGLAGRRCLVTGASTGIGRGIALALAGEGARLVISARSRQPLEELAGEMVGKGGAAPVLVMADLATPEGPRALAAAAERALGGIEVLINNAGGSRPLTADAGEEAWVESMALNFNSARHLVQLLSPAMKAAKWGRIVNVTGPSSPRR